MESQTVAQFFFQGKEAEKICPLNLRQKKEITYNLPIGIHEISPYKGQICVNDLMKTRKKDMIGDACPSVQHEIACSTTILFDPET